jgi:mersacidin/lichenicidin family type 2 lantibiotic
MSNDVRAWKDPLYREALIAAGETVFHPAGLPELSDGDLQQALGGAVTTSTVGTTAPECTVFTWRNWKACCSTA